MCEAPPEANRVLPMTAHPVGLRNQMLSVRTLLGPMGRLSTPLDAPLALFLLSALGGVWVSYDHSLAWPMLAAILSAVATYYLVVFASRSRLATHSLGVSGMLGGVVLAIWFLIQCGHLKYAESLHAVDRFRVLTRIFSRFASFRLFANSVATALAGWLPVTVAIAVGAQRSRNRLVTAACAAILTVAILLTASRGAWLALALCPPLWWATRSRRNLVFAAGVAICVVLTGFALASNDLILARSPAVSQALATLFDRPDRLSVYRGSWYLIQDFPLTGIGLGGTFAMIYSRYVLLIPVPLLTYSHNLFLQVWLSQGLAGMFAFAWLILGFFHFVWQASGQTPLLFAGAWLGVTATLLHGLSDACQYADGWPLLSLFALLGLAVSAADQPRQEQGRAPSSPRGAAVVVAGSLAALALLGRLQLTAMVCANIGALSQARGELVSGLPEAETNALLQDAAVWYGRAIAADSRNRTAHQRLGMLAMDARRLDEAIGHYEEAHQADPSNTTTRKALGLAYAWAGRLQQAEQLLTNTPDIVSELNVWGWWWGAQRQPEWAANAYRVSLLLRPDQPSVRDALAAMPTDRAGERSHDVQKRDADD